jgi:uncharacterized protein YndB with AHSA1/START domain
MQDRIEQQVVINAPLDRVWELVSTPGWWVPSTVEEPAVRTPGHQTVRQSEKWGRFPVEVVDVRPRDYAAFRWASQSPGTDLAPGNTTLVEFFVAAADDAISVTVVESGFAALDASDEVRETAWKANNGGWTEVLADLQKRSEASTVA